MGIVFCADFRDIRKVVKHQTIGNLSPFSITMIYGNSLNWVIYSILAADMSVFSVYAFGLLVSVFYIPLYVRYTPDHARGRMYFMLGCTTFFNVFAVAVFLYYFLRGEHLTEACSDAYNWIATALTVLEYYGLFDEMYKAIKRNHPTEMSMQCASFSIISGIFWVIYALGEPGTDADVDVSTLTSYLPDVFLYQLQIGAHIYLVRKKKKRKAAKKAAKLAARLYQDSQDNDQPQQHQKKHPHQQDHNNQQQQRRRRRRRRRRQLTETSQLMGDHDSSGCDRDDRGDHSDSSHSDLGPLALSSSGSGGDYADEPLYSLHNIRSILREDSS